MSERPTWHLADTIKSIRDIATSALILLADRVDTRYASAINPFNDENYPLISHVESPAETEEDLS